MAEKQNTEENRRSFEYQAGDDTRTYYIAMPTAEQLRKADWHYSKVYNKSLLDGIATEAEMLDVLRRRGLYGPEYDKKANDLQEEVAKKIVAMEEEQDPTKKRETALEVLELRRELYQWNQRLTGPLSNTCEQIAQDSKVEYLTSCVIQNQDGSLVWESHEDYLNEEDRALAFKARVEVLLWIQGVESDFLDNTPENKVLSGDQGRKALSEPQEEEQEEATTSKSTTKSSSGTSQKKRTRRKKTTTSQ